MQAHTHDWQSMFQEINFTLMLHILVCFVLYSVTVTVLRTIRCTLIFKQFKKKTFFTIFIIRLESQTKKKILVYKTELTFKIPENHHFFFQFFFTSPPIANVFFSWRRAEMPLSCSVPMFFCICYYLTFNLNEYLLFFQLRN